MQTHSRPPEGGSSATATTQRVDRGCTVVTEVKVADYKGPSRRPLQLLVTALACEIGLDELTLLRGRAARQIRDLGRSRQAAPPGATCVIPNVPGDRPQIVTCWKAGDASIEMVFDVEEPAHRVTVRVTASGRTDDLNLVASALMLELITPLELDFDKALWALESPDSVRRGVRPFRQAELAAGDGRTVIVTTPA